MKLEAAVISNIGLVREENQDNFYLAGEILLNKTSANVTYYFPQTDYSNFSFGVFDGMGGEKFGDVASLIAAKTFREFADLIANEGMQQNISELLISYCHDANMKVCNEAIRCEERMGTTAAVGCIIDDWLFTCNLGDSRIYLFRDDVLCQISEDHTEAKMLSKAGITFKGRKGRLVQYLGMHPSELDIEPVVSKIRLIPKDSILMCSDGLTDFSNDLEIVRSLRLADVNECVNGLMRNALIQGGKDNITAIVIKFTQ